MDTIRLSLTIYIKDKTSRLHGYPIQNFSRFSTIKPEEIVAIITKLIQINLLKDHPVYQTKRDFQFSNFHKRDFQHSI